MSVLIGEVETWPTGCTPREQAVKMSEEVMEVFAVLDQNSLNPATKCDAMRECIDVLVATCNLIEMLSDEVRAVHGDEFMLGEIAACIEHQRERGRL